MQYYDKGKTARIKILGKSFLYLWAVYNLNNKAMIYGDNVRVGNYIFNENNDVVTVQIKHHIGNGLYLFFCDTKINEFASTHLKALCNLDAKPIPINERFLRLLGFDFIVNDIWQGDEFMFKLSPLGGGTVLCDDQTSFYINYVHQLQNHYFQITGEELVFIGDPNKTNDNTNKSRITYSDLTSTPKVEAEFIKLQTFNSSAALDMVVEFNRKYKNDLNDVLLKVSAEAQKGRISIEVGFLDDSVRTELARRGFDIHTKCIYGSPTSNTTITWDRL